ncbi:DUF3397 domain-containing protein [Paenibacillus chartarius]|uniref:DUF3397 domain-containing protein n=1 Tax=Paenibacillus chartarius TaxID=747481 RepID=A0ABV6DUA3_9BACL
MNWLIAQIKSLYELLAVIPFIGFALGWGIGYAWFRDKKKSIRLAMDVTTLLLIGAVAKLWNLLFGSNFGFWLIVLVLLIAVGLLGGYQNRVKGAIDFTKIARIIWRVGFVCLSLLYVLFLIVNLGVYVIYTV